jgi:hypothetical protein
MTSTQAATHPVPDPVERHVAELARVLHGPAKARRSMIREVRDGLQDAVDAYRACGLDAERAAAKAVHDFGPIREVARQLQDELAARQGRWTALLIMMIFPGMTVGWDLLWRSGGVAWDAGPPPAVTVLLARMQDATTILVAVVAAALLVASFLRAAPPRPVARLVGVTAAVGAAVCLGAGVLMNLANGPAAAKLIVTNAYAMPAFAASGLVCAFIVTIARRALRTARED